MNYGTESGGRLGAAYCWFVALGGGSEGVRCTGVMTSWSSSQEPRPCLAQHAEDCGEESCDRHARDGYCRWVDFKGAETAGA